MAFSSSGPWSTSWTRIRGVRSSASELMDGLAPVVADDEDEDDCDHIDWTASEMMVRMTQALTTIFSLS